MMKSIKTSKNLFVEMFADYLLSRFLIQIHNQKMQKYIFKTVQPRFCS